MKILIADGDKMVRAYLIEVIRLNVARAGISKFLEEGDGKRALSTLILERPDLVYLDLHLPEVDAMQILHALRDLKNKALLSIPIILLSSRSDKRLLMEVVKLGVREVVIKPIDIEVLLQKTEHALQG